MENIFKSCVVNNLRSDTIVFKGQNNAYTSIEEYITEEYLERSLFMRDMIIARDENPLPQITLVSESGTDSIVTVLHISFAAPVDLYRSTDPPYRMVDLSSRITCTVGGFNNETDITHVVSNSRTMWTIIINSTMSLTNHSITLMADTFVNMYNNGNEEVVKVL